MERVVVIVSFVWLLSRSKVIECFQPAHVQSSLTIEGRGVRNLSFAIISSVERRQQSQLFLAKKSDGGGKKKRRRKAPSVTPEPAPTSVDDGDDLPDFDLDETEEELDAVIDDLKTTSKENTNSLSEDELMNVMKGRRKKSDKLPTTQDLIRDRSLEKYMKFSEQVKDPSLPVLGKTPMKTKTQPQVVTPPPPEPEQSSFEIPAFVRNLVLDDETQEFSFGKLVTSITWAGIFLLIGWEIYINSPFFERAAPMAPVVFRDVSEVLP